MALNTRVEIRLNLGSSFGSIAQYVVVGVRHQFRNVGKFPVIKKVCA